MVQKVLVVDVGGTHVKILASGQQTPRKIASGPKITAGLMCTWVRKAASDWAYDVAALGYPGPVVHGRPIHEPYNLGKGWVGFDYSKGLGCPVKVINDAAMQAVGSYTGGRMNGRKILRDIPVKRNSYAKFERWLQDVKSSAER